MTFWIDMLLIRQHACDEEDIQELYEFRGEKRNARYCKCDPRAVSHRSYCHHSQQHRYPGYPGYPVIIPHQPDPFHEGRDDKSQYHSYYRHHELPYGSGAGKPCQHHEADGHQHTDIIRDESRCQRIKYPEKNDKRKEQELLEGTEKEQIHLSGPAVEHIEPQHMSKYHQGILEKVEYASLLVISV